MLGHEGLSFISGDVLAPIFPSIIVAEDADLSLPAIPGIDHMEAGVDKRKRSQSRNKLHKDWGKTHANTTKTDKHPVPPEYRRRGQQSPKPH